MCNYDVFFFSIAIVSKSLLIVWGTLSIPAIMAVESTALRELQSIPAKACKTSGFPYFPQPVISKLTNPLFCLISEPISTAGSAGKSPAHPAYLYQLGKYRFIYKSFFRFSCQLYCPAVCPCQGSCLNCPARYLDFQNAKSYLLAFLASLDNSFPLHSCSKKSGKMSCLFCRIAQLTYTCRSALAALRPLRPVGRCGRCSPITSKADLYTANPHVIKSAPWFKQ